MLAEQRQQQIVELLKKHGMVRTAQLSKLMNVSTETVRKDLDTLDSAGLIHKVHGGALPSASKPQESSETNKYVPYEIRSTQSIDSKEHIAALAASLVKNGQHIALDDGTSGYMMTAALKDQFDQLTIVTNSIKSASALAGKPGFTVIVSGGVLTSDNYSCVGELSSLILDRFNVDILFLTTSGITAEGLTEQRIGEVCVQQQMIASAKKVVLLTDSSKFGKTSFVRLCSLNDIDVIVTDKEPDKDLAAAIREKGCELLIAQ